MEKISVKQPKKVLVVEDDEATRRGMSHILSMQGYLVDSISNGYEALNLLRRQEVDLIISDIDMPEMNGIDFLSEVTDRYPHINVIMVTGYGKVETYIESINLGAFEYLNKPVSINEMNALLKKVFTESN